MAISLTAPDVDPDADEMDCQVSSGFHAATVQRVYVNKDGQLCVVWSFTSDPWKGHVLAEKYQLPDLMMTSEGREEKIRFLWVFLYRMGLATKEQRGKPLNIDEQKLVGISRVLEIVREPAKKGKYAGRVFTNVRYGCQWSADRPEIPVADRVRLGLPLLPGQTMPLFDAKASTPAGGTNGSAGSGQPAQQSSPAFDPSEV